MSYLTYGLHFAVGLSLLDKQQKSPASVPLF